MNLKSDTRSLPARSQQSSKGQTSADALHPTSHSTSLTLRLGPNGPEREQTMRGRAESTAPNMLTVVGVGQVVARAIADLV
jgi:hypothetical protein